MELTFLLILFLPSIFFNIFSDYLTYMYKTLAFSCFTALSFLHFTKLAPAALNTFILV